MYMYKYMCGATYMIMVTKIILVLMYSKVGP